MKKLKGPDLKMPDLKVPLFLRELYYDLLDRRLLPLVGLVIVAIIAVPFLLSGGSKTESPLPSSAAGVPVASAGHTLTVVREMPGLRSYKRRLAGRSPQDPFKQKFTSPDLSGAEVGGGQNEEGGGGASTSVVRTSSTTTTTTNGSSTVTKKTTQSSGGKTTTTTTANGKNGGGSNESGKGGPPAGQPEELIYYAFSADVKTVKTSDKPGRGKETSQPQMLHEVLPPAALPSQKAQAVTYMGISPTTRKPLLLVSDAVTAVYGEAKCLSGESTCQLLEVETGIPTTFVYGESGVRYKITILKVTPVATGHS